MGTRGDVLKHLDLFSGIGGFALAAQRVWGAEHEIVGFCEINKYCQKLLALRFPGVPIYGDIRKLTARTLLCQGQEIKNTIDAFQCMNKECQYQKSPLGLISQGKQCTQSCDGESVISGKTPGVEKITISLEGLKQVQKHKICLNTPLGKARLLEAISASVAVMQENLKTEEQRFKHTIETIKNHTMLCGYAKNAIMQNMREGVMPSEPTGKATGIDLLTGGFP